MPNKLSGQRIQTVVPQDLYDHMSWVASRLDITLTELYRRVLSEYFLGSLKDQIEDMVDQEEQHET